MARSLRVEIEMAFRFARRSTADDRSFSRCGWLKDRFPYSLGSYLDTSDLLGFLGMLAQMMPHG